MTYTQHNIPVKIADEEFLL